MTQIFTNRTAIVINKINNSAQMARVDVIKEFPIGKVLGRFLETIINWTFVNINEELTHKTGKSS